MFRSNLFCYGTLMYPDIMAAVCGMSTPHAEHATLDNYARYTVRHKLFPGILPCQVAHVEGVLYRNLLPVHMQRLDAYESDFYVRVMVQVTTDTGVSVNAMTYIIPASKRQVLSQHRWDADRFERYFLPQYLAQLHRGKRVT